MQEQVNHGKVALGENGAMLLLSDKVLAVSEFLPCLMLYYQKQVDETFGTGFPNEVKNAENSFDSVRDCCFV